LKSRSTCPGYQKIKEGGILEFGTEVITTADGSLSVLLGASPGASTVSIMIDVVGRCFKEELASEWQEKIKKNDSFSWSGFK
jgi:malate dehydrogenase (quinone)